MTNESKNELEDLIDRYGLSHVVFHICKICEKKEHSVKDLIEAKRWEHSGILIAKTYEKIIL